MHFPSIVLCLSLGALVRDAAASDWCYTGCDHTPSLWKNTYEHCGGSHQSPINIDTGKAMTDQKLHDFNFVNFSDHHVIKSIKYNGHTVKCILEPDRVEVSGGGLNGTYSSIQFHFHWGDTEHHPGSEHTVNEHRYPMEMHIVSLKYNHTADEAQEISDGIAVLGFFIDEKEDEPMSEAWETLTSYLKKIPEIDDEVEVTHSISINDLIGHVNLTKFYRYMGSLTTPLCSEAVVWTVFREPIRIKSELIKMFPKVTGKSNVYRPTQQLNGRHMYASPEISNSWCYDHHHCDNNPSEWFLLPDSHCNGERQSPINIDTDKVESDASLKSFSFTKFDYKHAIKYITNTGHAVKCVLKENTVEVSGGALGHDYSTLQFHFHWGNHSESSEGSEHTVDSKRYPMEMHIVNKRKDLTLDEALKTPNGLAVLGFFIEVSHTSKSRSDSHETETEHPTSDPTSTMEAWTKLTEYLSNITAINSKVNVTHEISIDDLLGNVDRESYYRYNGSLTTPTCNEAVVWTVFKESVKVDQHLMMMFPKYAGYHNVYRPRQLLYGRKITTNASSATTGPIFFSLLLACLCILFR